MVRKPSSQPGVLMLCCSAGSGRCRSLCCFVLLAVGMLVFMHMQYDALDEHEADDDRPPAADLANLRAIQPPAQRPLNLQEKYFAERPNVPVFQGSATMCYRIPALLLTARGSLLAFAEARHDGVESCKDKYSQEIVVRRSTDGGISWSDMQPAAGSAARRVGNPLPIALRSGRVVVVFKYLPRSCSTKDCGGSKETLGNGIVFSDDDGITWQNELNITRFLSRAAGGQPGPGAGIQLASGRLLAVSHMGPSIRDEIFYSDDEGVTWRTSKSFLPRMDEGAFAEFEDNKVLLLMRHKDEFTQGKAVSRSFDGGLTWTDISYNKQLYGPNCQASLASLGQGVLLFANPANLVKKRAQIAVKASIDGGLSWHFHLMVECESTRGYTSLLHGFVSKERMLTGLLFETAEKGGIDFKLFRYNVTLALQRGSFPAGTRLHMDPRQNSQCEELKRSAEALESYR